ncbi:MAG: RluA family pseudouridine synthase [Candidatus Doudnabacteria bacterium]|nr:RluA family pseudouridine synthase [Candidatus Doudnabacteria bacterium]
MVKNFIVEDLKTRLDKFLSEQLQGVSRSQIQRDVEAGLVMVNGVVQKESKFVVRKGNAVTYEQKESLNSKFEIQATNTPLTVLYDNQGLLVIDKPAGLTVHPGAGFKGETLASALLYHFPACGGNNIQLVGEEGRPGIVHRLDKETSGVILVAKTQSMYEYLKDAFFERKVKKEYIALVAGRVEKQFGKIDLPIGKSKTDFRKHDVKNTIEPKEALTEYRVLEYLEGSGLDQYTLLLVKLHTGRTHQIRVHMKAIGHPLMGDSLYGGKRAQIPGLFRQFLHARKIEVKLPDGTWIEAESSIPADLKNVLSKLDSKTYKNL